MLQSIYKSVLSTLQKYWTWILPWVVAIVLAIVVHKQYTKLHEPLPTPPVDNRIDSLQNIVEQLNKDLLKSRHDYDSAQKNIKTDIIKIRIQNAQDVTNISNYDTKQLDSAWTTITFP